MLQCQPPSKRVFVAIDQERLPEFSGSLLDWFTRNGRDLPWRHSRDPYAIWVSEIMLQQTTTETVRSYFDRFLAHFPDLFALAQSGEESILALWQGLGYYRRALQMRRAAVFLVERYQGRFPQTIEELRALPGVGRYTAGAIRSLAFDLPSPILEANTRRLYARLTALTLDASSSAGEKILWKFAESILPPKNGRDFTLALMDLGATVCGAVPRCTQCPVRPFCAAAEAGNENAFPVFPPKIAPIPRRECAFYVRCPSDGEQASDGEQISDREQSSGREQAARYLFVRYPKHLRWGGLWDFPRFEFPVSDSPQKSAELLKKGSEFFGIQPIIAPGLWRLRHSVTRYTIELFFNPIFFTGKITGKITGKMTGKITGERRLKQDFWRGKEGCSIHFAGGETTFDAVEFRWLTLEQARDLAMSTTGKKLLTIAADLFTDLSPATPRNESEQVKPPKTSRVRRI